MNRAIKSGLKFRLINKITEVQVSYYNTYSKDDIIDILGDILYGENKKS